MAFDKSRSAGYLANHLARLFAIGLQQRIRPFGLAPAQFMTLLELWVRDGLTQAELVERLDVEQATMANTLARMARDGLIERKPHPDDKRAQQVWLTEKAKSLQGPATTAAAAQNEAALADLSPVDRDEFVRLMTKAIGNMRRSRSE